MRYFLSALLMFIVTAAWADTASDRRDCANNDFEAELRIDACTRLLDGADLDDASRARVLIERGDAREDLDQWDEALQDYHVARDLDPENPRIYRDIGWVFLSTKDFAGAMEPLNTAIDLDPRSAWGFHMRGMANARLKQFDASLADYNKALEIDPNRVSTYRARGFLHIRRDDHASAVADFDQVLALRPYWAETYSGRAKANETLGNDANAIRDARIAQLLNPNLGVPERVIERLRQPSGISDPGTSPFAASQNGRKFTYLQVITDVEKEQHPMEAAIFDLVNFFRAEVKPLPDSRNFVTREILSTDGNITTVNAARTYSKSKNSKEVTYFRAMLPTVFPTGGQGPTLEMAYDEEALNSIWPLQLGNKAQGGGDINIVCPSEPGPFTMMFQCQGGDRIPIGKLSWNTQVDGWEDVLVPGGVFATYVVSYSEKAELEMFGKTINRNSNVKWWYSPEHNWWVRRTSEFQGKVNIGEVVLIE